MMTTDSIAQTVSEWAAHLELVEVTYKTVKVLATGKEYYIPLEHFKQYEEELSDSSKYYVTPWQTSIKTLVPHKQR